MSASMNAGRPISRQALVYSDGAWRVYRPGPGKKPVWVPTHKVPEWTADVERWINTPANNVFLKRCVRNDFH